MAAKRPGFVMGLQHFEQLLAGSQAFFEAPPSQDPGTPNMVAGGVGLGLCPLSINGFTQGMSRVAYP